MVANVRRVTFSILSARNNIWVLLTVEESSQKSVLINSNPLTSGAETLGDTKFANFLFYGPNPKV